MENELAPHSPDMKLMDLFYAWLIIFAYMGHRILMGEWVLIGITLFMLIRLVLSKLPFLASKTTLWAI